MSFFEPPKTMRRGQRGWGTPVLTTYTTPLAMPTSGRAKSEGASPASASNRRKGASCIRLYSFRSTLSPGGAALFEARTPYDFGDPLARREHRAHWAARRGLDSAVAHRIL